MSDKQREEARAVLEPFADQLKSLRPVSKDALDLQARHLIGALNAYAEAAGLYLTTQAAQDRYEAYQVTATLYAPTLIAALAALAFASPRPTAAEQGKGEWRCFHCNDIFTDRVAAEQHFGLTELETPACAIKGSEGGLLKALRGAEQAAYDFMAQLEAESAEGLRALAGNQSRHAAALMSAEETGYERGLADGRALATQPNEQEAGELREAALDADLCAHTALEAGMNGGAVAWRDGLVAVQQILRKALASTPPASVQGDTVLVRREPTEAMLTAGVGEMFGSANDDWNADARGIWSAMLDAASPPLLQDRGEG